SFPPRPCSSRTPHSTTSDELSYPHPALLPRSTPARDAPTRARPQLTGGSDCDGRAQRAMTQQVSQALSGAHRTMHQGSLPRGGGDSADRRSCPTRRGRSASLEECRDVVSCSAHRYNQGHTPVVARGAAIRRREIGETHALGDPSRTWLDADRSLVF